MISPLVVDVNLNPTSTAFGSFTFAVAGVALELNRVRLEDGETVYETPGCGRLKIEAVVNGAGFNRISPRCWRRESVAPIFADCANRTSRWVPGLATIRRDIDAGNHAATSVGRGSR